VGGAPSGEGTGKPGESAFVITDAGARVSEAVLANIGPGVSCAKVIWTGAAEVGTV
jgi:hypothetical protein